MHSAVMPPFASEREKLEHFAALCGCADWFSLEESIEHCEKARALAEGQNDSCYLAKAYYNTGATFSGLSLNKEAQSWFRNAERFSGACDLDFAFRVSVTLGRNCALLDAVDLATTYFEKAETQVQDHPTRQLHFAMHNGHHLMYSGRLKEGLVHLRRAEKLAREAKDTIALAGTLMGIGNSFVITQRLDSAIYYERKSLQYYQMVGEELMFTRPMWLLGDCFVKTGVLDSASHYFDQGCQRAICDGDPYFLRQHLLGKVAVAEAKQDFQRALDLRVVADSLSEEMIKTSFAAKKERIDFLLNASGGLALRELELESVEAGAQAARNWVIFFAGLTVLSVLSFVMIGVILRFRRGILVARLKHAEEKNEANENAIHLRRRELLAFGEQVRKKNAFLDLLLDRLQNKAAGAGFRMKEVQDLIEAEKVRSGVGENLLETVSSYQER
ncbi:MAG: hypothetical protein AAF570_03115, partial [Bacteroidota bacterium]